jgi:hypothetical protein
MNNRTKIEQAAATASVSAAAPPTSVIVVLFCFFGSLRKKLRPIFVTRDYLAPGGCGKLVGGVGKYGQEKKYRRYCFLCCYVYSHYFGDLVVLDHGKRGNALAVLTF